MNIDKLDQEIQDALDEKLPRESVNEENQAYLLLYEVLNNMPAENYLPKTFADNVVRKINVKPSNKDSEAFWWLSSMIVFMMLTGILVVVLIIGTLKIETIDFIFKYLPIVVFASVVIGAVQWLDRRLIKFHT